MDCLSFRAADFVNELPEAVPTLGTRSARNLSRRNPVPDLRGVSNQRDLCDLVVTFRSQVLHGLYRGVRRVVEAITGPTVRWDLPHFAARGRGRTRGRGLGSVKLGGLAALAANGVGAVCRVAA